MKFDQYSRLDILLKKKKRFSAKNSKFEKSFPLVRRALRDKSIDV